MRSFIGLSVMAFRKDRLKKGNQLWLDTIFAGNGTNNLSEQSFRKKQVSKAQYIVATAVMESVTVERAEILKEMDKKVSQQL